jgi:membrane protein DedA with SNARE-associated domain
MILLCCITGSLFRNIISCLYDLFFSNNITDKTNCGFDLSEWIVYVIIAVILLINVLVVLFLKKSKDSLEEEI